MHDKDRRGYFEIVEVEWLDAQHSTDPLTLEEIRDMPPVPSKSTGYLVHETDDHIVLSFMQFGEEMVKHHQCIPKGIIINIRELMVDKKSKRTIANKLHNEDKNKSKKKGR